MRSINNKNLCIKKNIQKFITMFIIVAIFIIYLAPLTLGYESGVGTPFDGNGGMVLNPQTGKYEAIVKIWGDSLGSLQNSPTKASREGYLFKGWSTKKDDTKVELYPGEQFWNSSAGDGGVKTYYAVWEKGRGY